MFRVMNSKIHLWMHKWKLLVLVDIEDVVATTSALAGEFGISVDRCCSDLSAQVIDTAKAVGLSNEEAAKLSGILQTTSGLSREQAEQLTEGAFQLALPIMLHLML